MPDGQMLPIVDEEDTIIGTETRESIHKLGLRHREVNIIFITPERDIIFQHRATDKDTFPDLLDAAVGGHVEIGDTYEQTAIKETKEETGLTVVPAELTLIQIIKRDYHDEATGKDNNVFRAVYGYYFTGTLERLGIEAGKSVGFEAWPLKKLWELTEEEKERFIPALIGPDYLEMYRKIEKLNFK